MCQKLDAENTKCESRCHSVTCHGVTVALQLLSLLSLALYSYSVPKCYLCEQHWSPVAPYLSTRTAFLIQSCVILPCLIYSLEFLLLTFLLVLFLNF